MSPASFARSRGDVVDKPEPASEPETGPADCDEQDFLRRDPNEVIAERLRGDPSSSAEA